MTASLYETNVIVEFNAHTTNVVAISRPYLHLVVICIFSKRSLVFTLHLAAELGSLLVL